VDDGEKRMSYPKKEEIIKLVQKVNESRRRIQRNMYPIEYNDDGWRIVFPKALEFYDFCSAGRKLLEMAMYDFDFQDGYYWIPYKEPPKNVVTPAIRLMRL
jgi:hypothetical protein